MALNLGLESLQGTTDSVVSLEQAFITMQTAELNVITSYNELRNFIKDVINFREVVNTSKKYASEECKEFAADLLGLTVASLEAEQAKDGSNPNESVKEGFGTKLKKFGIACIDYLKKFWAWFKQQVSKFIAYVKKAASEFRPIKVSVSINTLKAAGKVIATYMKKGGALDLSMLNNADEQLLNTPEAAEEYYKIASAFVASLVAAAEKCAKTSKDPKEVVTISKLSHRICGSLQRDLARCFKAMSKKMANTAENAQKQQAQQESEKTSQATDEGGAAQAKAAEKQAAPETKGAKKKAGKAKASNAKGTKGE